MEDKKKIEAVLFAVGDKIEEEEVARLTKISLDTVKAELSRLKEDYNQANSTFILINEGTKWKLTVREDYMPIVQKIVPKTELSRPVLETLAVIAWKSPVLQSNIVNIRSSKAYDHIGELEQVGFITKQKYGRSFMLRLSQQFFEYFDIKGKEQIKDVFKGIKGTEKIASPDKKLQDFDAGEDGTEEGDADLPEGSVENLPAGLPESLPAEVPVAGLPAESAPAALPAVSEGKNKDKDTLPMEQPPEPEKALLAKEEEQAKADEPSPAAQKPKKERKPRA